MTISLPTDWGEVTIGQFIELSRAKQLDLDPLEQMIEIISILSKEDRETISRLSIDSLKACFLKLEFITKDITGQVKPEIEVSGRVFIAKTDISKITAGQYIDLKNYTKEPKEALFNLHYIMSVFYQPKGKKYGKYDLNEVADLFYDKVSVEVAYPLAVFFSNLLSAWKLVIVDSLQKETAMKIQAMKIT